MDIGELNRRVEILKYFVKRDAYGGEDGRWLPVGRVWAKIEPVSGTEYFTAQQVSAETVTKITIRFYAGLDVMHRIRYADKLYEIIGISDADTAHRWTVINCKEMVGDGLQRKATESQSEHRGCGCDCKRLQGDG